MTRPKTTFSGEIRRAIREAPMSRAAISRETGVDQAVLCRFVGGSRGLTTRTLDTLAAFLDLHITVGRSKTPRKRGVK